VLLPALAGVLKGTGDAPDPSQLLQAITLTLGKVAAFIVIMLVVGRKVIPWILHYVAHTGSRELFRLAVLSIALGFAYLAAELFGVSLALGAFFAGMILSESRLSQQAATESLPLRDAFAVLFFVSVGMLFDPRIIIEAPSALFATIFIILIAKTAAAYLVVRLFGHAMPTALAISLSLAQIGEFSFILAGLGVALAILPADARDLILAGAIISILLNPLVMEFLNRLPVWHAAQEDGVEVGPPPTRAGASRSRSRGSPIMSCSSDMGGSAVWSAKRCASPSSPFLSSRAIPMLPPSYASRASRPSPAMPPIPKWCALRTSPPPAAFWWRSPTHSKAARP
jgi:K+:H+ antiporter